MLRVFREELEKAGPDDESSVDVYKRQDFAGGGRSGESRPDVRGIDRPPQGRQDLQA